MPTKPTPDPSDLLYKGESVLGKGTEVEMPGTVGAPLSAGIASTPVEGGGAAGGAAGVTSGGLGVGDEGTNLVQLVQQALGATEKTASFGQKLSDTLRGTPDLATAAGSLGPTTPGVQPEPSFLTDFLGGIEEGGVPAGSVAPDAATSAGTSGVAGGLGTATAGAGATAAILGLLASLTGNKDLGEAAKGLGVGTGALGLANTGLGLASLAPLLGTTTAAVPVGAAAGLGSGAATGLATGGTAGLGTAAGAAFAPIVAMMLASAISGLAGGEDPVGEGIGDALEPTAGRYHKFAPELAATLGSEGAGINSLLQLLPYVNSKEELGQLLNTYKDYIATGGGYTGGVGGYGAGSKMYEIPGLPGAGGNTHEGGIQADFPQWGLAQRTVNDLLQQMPGEDYAGAAGLTPGTPLSEAWKYYAQPGGPLSGRQNQSRLFNWGEVPNEQLVNYITANPSATPGGVVPGGEAARQGLGRELSPGSEGYDYRLPGAAPNVGAMPMSAYFQALQAGATPQQAQQAAQQAGGAPGAIGEQIDELIRRAVGQQ